MSRLGYTEAVRWLADNGGMSSGDSVEDLASTVLVSFAADAYGKDVGAVAKKLRAMLRTLAARRHILAVARRCPLCGAVAVLPLTRDLLAKQPDGTTHVCHPDRGGCNHGFELYVSLSYGEPVDPEHTIADPDADEGNLPPCGAV